MKNLEKELRSAAQVGYVKLATLLLDQGADVNGKDKDGSTPIHYTASYGRANVATLLLDRGADVNGKNNRGWTPTHYAAWNGHADVVALLLDRGAEVNVKTNNGRTPLELTNSLNRKIRNILVEKGELKCKNY